MSTTFPASRGFTVILFTAIGFGVVAGEKPPSTIDVLPAPTPSIEADGSEVARVSGLSSPREPSELTAAPSFVLPSDPQRLVVELWIGGGLIEKTTHLLLHAGGALSVKNPDRLSGGTTLYSMTIEPSEIEELVEEIAASGALGMTTPEVEGRLTRTAEAGGSPLFVADNVYLVLAVSLDAYQASAQDEPIAGFEHTVRIPHPRPYAAHNPASRELDPLVRAVDALVALTKDSRLRPTGSGE